MNQFMIIETFAPGAKDKIYQRFHEKGPMLPGGLNCIESWLEKSGDRCFQLMVTTRFSKNGPKIGTTLSALKSSN